MPMKAAHGMTCMNASNEAYQLSRGLTLWTAPAPIRQRNISAACAAPKSVSTITLPAPICSATRKRVHGVRIPGDDPRGLRTGHAQPGYYHRYTDDNVDLCDVLSSFSYGAKVKLDELSRIMGLAHSPIATSSSAGGAGLFDKHLASTIHCVDA